MSEQNIVNIKPFAYVISLIEGKWKMHILFWLWKKETMRYGELRKALESVSNKMLSNQLKVLESDGLIMRTEYPHVPPKVEYSLTETGHSLMPVLQYFVVGDMIILRITKSKPVKAN